MILEGVEMCRHTIKIPRYVLVDSSVSELVRLVTDTIQATLGYNSLPPCTMMDVTDVDPHRYKEPGRIHGKALARLELADPWTDIGDQGFKIENSY